MSRTYAKIRDKLIAEARAKTKCWALVDGRVAVSTHEDAMAANRAMCAALDALEEKTGTCEGHRFDIVALSSIPAIGQPFDPTTIVFYP